MTSTCPKQWIFSPQVTVVGSIPVPSTMPPTFSKKTDLVLSYPYPTPSITCTLRAPELGNDNTLTVEAVRQVTMANVMVIGRNPIWPIVEIYKYTFSTLTDAQVDSYFNFINASAGKEIGLRDHRDQNYRGYILNPEAAVSTDQSCSNNLSISFRGIRV